MENIVNSTIALYKAYRKTRCGKRDNPTAMRYRMEAIERTVALSERLQRRDYSFGPYYPFKVYEPKERLVLAIDFEGKAVQHSLCDNVLEPAFSRRFIRDNYAGQIGKGTHDGLDRLAAAMRHYFFSRKAADEAARKAAGLPPRPMNEWDYADGWVLKGDFSKFFYTLLHSYCYETARRALKWLKDPELIDFAEWLLWLIIDSTPDPGIPIGNQSSQLLALLYLDAFDHWLRDDRGLVYGQIHGRLLHHPQRQAAAPADTQGDRGVHQAARPSAERQDADPPAEERHRLPRFSHLPHADRQGREESASQEHRQHEAQDPQVPRAGGLRQDDTRQRRAILRELDGPHLTRQHLPPAAEHGRLFLQLFPGAQTITERRHNSWPKN